MRERKVDLDILAMIALGVLAIVLITLPVKAVETKTEESAAVSLAVPIEAPEPELVILESEEEEIIEETISDRDILAMVVMAEAGGEKFIGKVAVAATVLNRSCQWGKTIESIVSEEGQYVYPYYGTVSAACYEAVDYAMENRDLFPKNMFYFRNTKYHDFGEPYIQIGRHYFSTDGLPEYDLESLGIKD